MPTIAYNAVDDHLSRTSAKNWPPVTLICGEEMLCKTAFGAVLAALVPEAERAIGVETFDGGDDSIGAVLTSLNTYALLSSAKVVVFKDARLFYSAKTRQGLREKIVQAGRSGNMKKASRPFLNFMALSGLVFDDLAVATHRKKIADDVDGAPAAWLTGLVDYCRQKGLGIPDRQDESDLLLTAMHKGFPQGYRLVITTDLADRRKALFKAIDETGLVVDCRVPKGETRADRAAQDAVMQATMDDALGKAAKQIAANARRRLVRWTGFDLRTLAGNLEKLISFVGDRKRITDADVTAVLQRTRKDPIFEFTNALAERNLSAMLFFMKSLLDDGMHPLQLLAAAANQIRRLLLAKDFIIRDRGRSWSAHMAFAQFKTGPFKAVKQHDTTLAALMETWDSLLNPAAGGKKSKKTASSDLVLARNPRSPFPVFQTLNKADRFSMDELSAAMCRLSRADLHMKSTGQDPRLLLESVLIDLCRGRADGPTAAGDQRR